MLIPIICSSLFLQACQGLGKTIRYVPWCTLAYGYFGRSEGALYEIPE